MYFFHFPLEISTHVLYAKREYPDQTPQSAVSDLGLEYLPIMSIFHYTRHKKGITGFLTPRLIHLALLNQ